jgi:hypothetical protein
MMIKNRDFVGKRGREVKKDSREEIKKAFRNKSEGLFAPLINDSCNRISLFRSLIDIQRETLTIKNKG